VFIIINKYTLTLAWIATPILDVVYFVEGDTECSVLSLLGFIVGLTYMVAGHRAGWGPFRENHPDYVVAQVYQQPYQQPYHQDPCYQ